MIIIRTQGIIKAKNFLINLPKEIERSVIESGETFMDLVTQMAKRRAPVYTGRLKNSIFVIKKGKGQNMRIVLSVNVPYGKFQELGFSGHFISAKTSTRGGGFVRDYMNKAGLRGPGIFVQKYTPFLQPSLEKGLGALPNLLSTKTLQGIRRAKR